MKLQVPYVFFPHWNMSLNSRKTLWLPYSLQHIRYFNFSSNKTQIIMYTFIIIAEWLLLTSKMSHWESLEELLLESVDITSTSSVVWFLVSIETLPCPPTVMWISPDGCHANWFCWDAGSSEIMIMTWYHIWRKIPLTFTKCYSKVYGKVTVAKT